MKHILFAILLLTAAVVHSAAQITVANLDNSNR